jgi:hypothetical protein
MGRGSLEKPQGLKPMILWQRIAGLKGVKFHDIIHRTFRDILCTLVS